LAKYAWAGLYFWAIWEDVRVDITQRNYPFSKYSFYDWYRFLWGLLRVPIWAHHRPIFLTDNLAKNNFVTFCWIGLRFKNHKMAPLLERSQRWAPQIQSTFFYLKAKIAENCDHNIDPGYDKEYYKTVIVNFHSYVNLSNKLYVGSSLWFKMAFQQKLKHIIPD
jgi:hypothetical protein